MTDPTNLLDPAELDRLRGLDDAALLAETIAGMRRAAGDLAWVAAAFQELARRGNDVAERAADICRSGVWLYLPLVAAGKVSPLAMAAFGWNEPLLSRVAQLPVAQQERYALGDDWFDIWFFNTPEAVARGLPEFDCRRCLPSLLPAPLLDQVFDTSGPEARVRDKPGQWAYLRAAQGKPRPTRRVRKPAVRVDPEHLLIYVDDRGVSLDAVLAAVADLAAESPEAARKVRQFKTRVAGRTA